MEKLILQNRKNQKIVGLLEKPETEIKGTCVVQHGLARNKECPTVLAMTKAFLESGFQTFRFDSTNTFGESDGEYEKSTLGLHSEDLEDITKWVQEQKWYQGPLALTGHSNGGYAVIRYAQEYPDEISIVVPVGPVVSGRLFFEEQAKKQPELLKRWKEEGFLTEKHYGNTYKKPWTRVEEFVTHDLFPCAEKITMPILFVVGSNDAVCLPEHIRMLFDTIPKGSKTLEVIDSPSHFFTAIQEQTVLTEVIKNWLDTNKK